MENCSDILHTFDELEIKFAWGAMRLIPFSGYKSLTCLFQVVC